ncbi:MAG TPA: hypothetical protein VEL76_41595 [Gemmataceae bacterium]|nr:hypothetical protein [Gemmataceae bacterium]
MAVVLTPFLVLSVTGLVLSLVAHAAALLGLPPPLGPAAWWLNVGIFVVWLPALIVWEGGSLRGCPCWMRWLTYGFFGYGGVSFLLFRAVTPPESFGGFSGHWIAFYSAAAAILYSAIAISRSDPARRCPNGHPVSTSASYCEACGADIAEQRVAGSCRPDAEPGAAADGGGR